MLSSILLSTLAVSLATAAPSPGLGSTPHSFLQRDDSDSTPFMSAAWYPGWEATNASLSSINWEKYSLISWAFAVTTTNTSVLSLVDSGGSLVKEFVGMAKKNNVMAGITIGGWTGSRYFSTAVGNPENRSSFVQAVNNLVSEYGIDAVDFDWEFPNKDGIGCNEMDSSDSENFLTFLQQLRKESPKKDLHISAAVSVAPFVGSDGNPMTNVSDFAAVLDHIAIMAYDINGQWSNVTGPNAPLDDSCSDLRTGSATGAIKAWTDAGFPQNKIILGVPAYGHSFNVSLPSNDLLDHQNFTKSPLAGPPNQCKEQEPVPDTMDFASLISQGYLNSDGTPSNATIFQFDNCSQTPFLYHKEKKLMVYYDDPQSFAAKGEFIAKNNLLGFYMWDVTGDFNNLLIDAIHNGSGVTEC